VQVAAEAAGIPLGFHAHDGLSLAFINSLASLNAGCRYLDASLSGLGKGGGNLCLELIVGYLLTREKTDLSMATLVPAAAAVITPWKDGAVARCESIAASLLDLNVDAIQRLRSDHPTALFELVEQMPSPPSPEGARNAAVVRR
jgi:4-hydroxy 2-oxovalerate aldolase